jgi:hypothetical protein
LFDQQKKEMSVEILSEVKKVTLYKRKPTLTANGSRRRLAPASTQRSSSGPIASGFAFAAMHGSGHHRTFRAQRLSPSTFAATGLDGAFLPTAKLNLHGFRVPEKKNTAPATQSLLAPLTPQPLPLFATLISPCFPTIPTFKTGMNRA